MRRRACEPRGMDPNGWYFCLKHQQVEPPGKGCRSTDRLGPYSDRATAEQALELARQRTETADEADRVWDEGPEDGER